MTGTFRVGCLLATGLVGFAALSHAGQPNILWLTIEDTSAYEFGCYGNAQVKTPNIDGLAEKGLQYMKAWSTAPHCSPARSTLITGCYATTFAMDNHRHQWDTPGDIFYPPLMRRAGYYCTNNSKTDYNTTRDNKAMWDECSKSASYNSPQRGKDQPFFAVFNAFNTHMSRLTSITLEGRRDFAKEGLDPAKLKLPPYVPDIAETRSDYAFHLEGVQEVDEWVGIFLHDLEERGLAEDTIVIFNSDHGGCLPRGKGFLYESGLQVPLIVYLPPKYQFLAKPKPGSKTDRLVGFVDFAPTLLSLIGVKPPEWMQGRAFLGKYDTEPRLLQFAFRTNQETHYDPCRAVTDGRFKYIRAYLPNKAYCLRNSFQWQMPSNLGWDGYALEHRTPERAAEHPEWMQPFASKAAEMLFDLQTDPYELHNLAGEPAHLATLEKMRAAIAAHVRETKDLGFFPPTTKIKGEGVALYDWVREKKYDLNALITAAETASEAKADNKARLLAYLASGHPEVRFWGAAGLSALARQGLLVGCPDELAQPINDPDPAVAATAAEGCCFAGRSELGIPALIKGLGSNTGDAKDLFHSSLETLTWYPEQAKLLASHAAEIHEAGGFPARSVLVNLDELPIDKLYTSKERKKGIEVNETRRPLKPTP
ncbi:MAG: sulfatase [Kiritimatiellales bacterium]|nr:sulfatase [Kiritimatiellales bacterium]